MNLLYGKKWLSWPRALVLLATALGLFLVFRQLDLGAVTEAVKRMQAGWFVLAFLVYGGALLFGACRWHIALRLTGVTSHLEASCRLFLVGHFFLVALFGVAGGDLAKSAVYARWYRFPLPEVIAAAPLDRGLGLTGPVLLLGSMFGLAGATGGLAQIAKLNLSWPGVWVLVGIVAVALGGVALVFFHPRGESVWARTIRAFRAGGARLLLTPRDALPGILFTLLAQLGFSGVLALNLQAVTQSQLPWAQLAWTFPVITAISALPFTVAGAGVREVAAMTLLGIYGVPAADCVAASLFTFLHKVAWAGIGAAVLWREESLHLRAATRPAPQTISVVMPVSNEAEGLRETVRKARAVPEVREVIVVDGGSRDGTPEVAAQCGCRVLTSAPSRGRQMRLGAAEATGDIVLLLHADTWLPPEAGRAVLNCLRDPTVVAGGFWKVFRATPWLLLGSRWKCAVRLLVGRRIVGDQALFVRREVLERVGGVPDMALMEEFELCRRLRREGRLALACGTVSTSARRFEKHGVLGTYLRMWRVSTLYRLGRPAQELRRVYERE